MTPEELFRLQEKYLAGLCSPEEVALLKQHEHDFQLLEHSWMPEQGDQEQVKDKILQRLHQEMEKQPSRRHTFGYYYAAAAVLLVGLFVLLFNPQLKDPQQQLSTQSQAGGKPIIKPGTTKATLTLSDGTVINLDDVANGIISQQGSILVAKSADGKLIYKVNSAPGQALIYNTISTPRGGEYQVVLPDGTHVWLNAASTLRFPSVFSAAERKVELTGEAYFEVAKHKNKPFKIDTRNMGIEVLGTHFNVNAYDDEAQIKTTLLEGSVRLHAGNNHQLLKPGQQARLGKQSDFSIAEVNVEEAIAWKKGYFIFDNENIESIMRKVSRWYDVEVTYKGKVDQGRYGGTVSRFDSVEGVLKSLELTGSVHFRMEGRRIIVMP
jgi:ferric-dicitrate binding protein FerR (iron transport regulator)